MHTLKTSVFPAALLAIALVATPIAVARTKVLETTSGFDGTRQLYVNPHVAGMSHFRSLELGASWSTSAPESVVLSVGTTSGALPTAIDFNVDGRIIEVTRELTPPDVDRTAIGLQVIRKFEMTLEQFNAIAHGTRVWARLTTVQGTLDHAIRDGKAQPVYAAFSMLADRIAAQPVAASH
jgi:hypothetical protein